MKKNPLRLTYDNIELSQIAIIVLTSEQQPVGCAKFVQIFVS